jgi:TolB-like protein/tRNA A-37 threonylcarbamoyl transferase component Bud32
MNGTTVLSGTFAGRYEIESELGRGATSIVYLARDTRGGGLVAVKVLKAELAESLGANRFLKEIRLNERLHHPRILPVLDSGNSEGRLYFVLPHMEGGTLRARLERNKQLPLDEAIAITQSIAKALAHAHEKELIHRDVKPENILFTNGQAFLGDFGIARALERSLVDGTTSSSMVRGTPPYMSPEQASGEKSLDARTDIYSLGCVVYEMLAGMQPFVGPTPQSVIAQRFVHAPRPLRVYRPMIGTAVEAAVARALAIAPADRFQTATEFADALDRASRTPDVRLPEDSIADARRWPRYAALTLVGIVAVLAATMSSFRHSPETVAGIPEGDARRLAVLYFDDLTPGKNLGHVAAGLTEDLIDQLSQVQAIRVTSPNGVRTFRDKDLPLDSIARRLGTGTLISGSVSSSGALLRVTVRLIDAKNGAQLNSHTLQHPMWSLFTLQDSIANDVALWLRERLGRQVRLRAQLASASSVPAWELVQRGENLSREAGDLILKADPAGAKLFQSADSAFSLAEAMDPKWPVPTISRARNALSRAFVYTDSLGRPTPSFASQLHRAVWYADRALARPPIIAEALTIRGEARLRLVSLTNAQPADSLLALAEADLHRAVTARPDVARSWYALGAVRFRQGSFTAASDAFKTAYETDAFATNIRAVLSELLFATLFAGRFTEADRLCRGAQRRYPDDPRFTQCDLNVLGWAGQTRRDANSAWSAVGRIERTDSTGTSQYTWSFRRMMVAAVIARAGMRDSARAVVRRTGTERGSRPSAALAEAYVRVLLGENDEALRLISLHLAESPSDRAVIANHPWFQKLHENNRFATLIGT